MTTITINWTIDFVKNNIDYEEFIEILSKKINLDNLSKASLEYEWVEHFSENEEENLLNLNSVNSLFNSIK